VQPPVRALRPYLWPLLAAAALLLCLARPATGHAATPSQPITAAASAAGLDPSAGWHGRPIRRALRAGAPGRRSTRTTWFDLAPGAGYATANGSPAVRMLQRRLRRLGYAVGPVDGHYGPRTRSAVGWFQLKHGLRADGVAGPATQRRLQARVSGGAGGAPRHTAETDRSTAARPSRPSANEPATAAPPSRGPATESANEPATAVPPSRAPATEPATAASPSRAPATEPATEPAPIRKARRWPRGLGLVATVGASAVLAAGVAIAVVSVDRAAAEQEYEGTIEALAKVNVWTFRVDGEPDAQRVALARADGTPGATLVFSPATTDLVVVATDLATPPAGKEYRCWVELDGQRERVGKMFFGGGLAYWAGPVPAAARATDGTKFGISLAPIDAQGTDSEPVMVGEL